MLLLLLLLSSGESTRLALALETCTYVSTNMKANENNEIISDSLDTSSPHISRGSVSGSNNEENNNDQSSSNNDSRGDSYKNIKFSDNDSNSSYDNNNKNGNAKEIITSSQTSEEPEPKQESSSQIITKTKFESLLIFDEIDAHIGGESFFF